jgi:hypothetical protein
MISFGAGMARSDNLQRCSKIPFSAGIGHAGENGFPIIENAATWMPESPYLVVFMVS